MSVRCLGFALLLWIPGELLAQSAEESCSAPILDKGYFLPVQESYLHETQIIYACDNGYKPAVEGWWATSTCQNGNWSHAPQCIDETFCFPLTIPNAKDFETSSGFHENGHIIEITCNKGYVPKDQQNSGQCKNGKWISVPVCEKSPRACSEPPNIPNSVIIRQKYQDVFDMGSEVEYQCKDGYVTENKKTKTSITCNDGTWTEGSMCRLTSSSGSNEGDTKPAFVSIYHCGDFPDVPNSDREGGQRSLKYTCLNFYKLEGPETVVCHSDGTWSEVPTCREDFCSLNTAEHPELENVGVKYIKNGETKELDCTDVHIFPNYSVVQCINGKLHKTRCCNRGQIKVGTC